MPTIKKKQPKIERSHFPSDAIDTHYYLRSLLFITTTVNICSIAYSVVMTKRYKRESIEVACEAGHPVTFRWRKGDYAIVEIVDRWVLQALWWQEEIRRTYYQVITSKLGVYSLYTDGEAWYWGEISGPRLRTSSTYSPTRVRTSSAGS